jgi:hypothetical protein
LFDIVGKRFKNVPLDLLDTFSDFCGWGGDCAPSGSSCLVTMATDSDATVFFSTAPPKAKIGTTGYISLNGVYIANPTLGPTAILARDAELDEDLAMGSWKDIILIGGYDNAFSVRSGNPTILSGLITFSSRSLTVDGLVVK